MVVAIAASPLQNIWLTFIRRLPGKFAGNLTEKSGQDKDYRRIEWSKPVLSHTTLGVADVRAAQGFYRPLLGALGLVVKFADDKWIGWKHPAADRPLFIITHPFDDGPASAGNGQMIAFLASSRRQVDECHALALEHGGKSEGEPGPRPAYHPDYYGAYFRDPYGNKLCVCCHEAE